MVQGLVGVEKRGFSKRLAKQKFSHWAFPVNSNEAEIFFA